MTEEIIKPLYGGFFQGLDTPIPNRAIAFFVLFA